MTCTINASRPRISKSRRSERLTEQSRRFQQVNQYRVGESGRFVTKVQHPTDRVTSKNVNVVRVLVRAFKVTHSLLHSANWLASCSSLISSGEEGTSGTGSGVGGEEAVTGLTSAA